MPLEIPIPNRALTIWRPWDHAILHAGKNIENRSWALWEHMLGKPIALHAGKRYDTEGAEWMRSMLLHEPPPKPECPTGIVGVFVVDRVIDESNCDMDPFEDSPWFFGRYGWVISRTWTLPRPISCNGAQGLWIIPPSVRAELVMQCRSEG